jgi:hypothetical protein
MSKSKIYIRTKDGREMEVLTGSYLYLKKNDSSGIYWEWPKITALQDEIQQFVETAEGYVEKVKSRLGEVIEEETFPHD